MFSGNSGFPGALASRLGRLVVGLTAICASLLVSAPASAASLVQVTANWSGGTTEPSYISMYEYVPNNVATNPPILVVVHYCGGSASGIFGEAQGGNIISAADSQGFIMIFPQLASSRNCWDVATTASLTHATGTASGGDTKAIVDMVKYEISTRHANADRVYSIGSSSGAMMTEALLAVYPDVFKGGSEFAGVPAGCWSDQYATSNQWSGPCAGGTNTMTAAAWGTLARNMYPGYTGFRPRIQLWHGSADTTISPTNQTEAIKQWTNVLNLATNPTTTTTVTISGHSYSRQQWTDASCGQTLLDAWTESNGPHGTDANMNGQYSLPFLALDKTPFAATDPQVACGTTGTGTGGSTGSGGNVGTGGAGGRGGTSGAAGTSGTAGTTGTTGTAGRGGTTGTAGRGGTTGTAGTSGGSAGTTGTSTGNAGTTGTSGSAGTTGTTGAAGTTGASGTTGTGTGAGGDNTSGAAGTTGTGTGTGDTGGTSTPPPAPAGCSCEVANTPSAVSAFLLAGLFVVMFGRRRPKRSANRQ